MAKTAEPKQGTRRYHSPRRKEQAEATRTEILDAAERLFIKNGYVATSMAAIAKEAGVALKTVYLGFETKSGLLRALWHRNLRGGREDVPVGEQDWFLEVLEEPDPATALRLNARNSRQVKTRIAPLGEVLLTADILWTLNHPRTYLLLLDERGWTPEEYERWLADITIAELLK